MNNIRKLKKRGKKTTSWGAGSIFLFPKKLVFDEKMKKMWIFSIVNLTI
jgi:hypothetical protein